MTQAPSHSQLLLGAHVSIAGGIEKAFARGEAIGCTAIQIFTRNASRWQARPLADAEIEAFRSAQLKSPIGYIAAHDSYLINLASPDPELRNKSIIAFTEELQRCARLGIGDLVMHPGAHTGAGPEAGLRTLIESFRSVLAEAPGEVRILLENTAGQGSSLGAKFSDLAEVMDRLPEGNFGICLDSCHAFAAGYDLASPAGYASTMDEIDRLIGCERIALFHLNDSKKSLGARVDRHEHVGQGCIGCKGFHLLMRDRRFRAVPKIIETPGGEDHCHDLANLTLLRQLAADQKGD